MEQLFSDLEKTTHISTHGDYMHMITENGDKIIKASDFVKEMSDGELIIDLSWTSRIRECAMRFSVENVLEIH